MALHKSFRRLRTALLATAGATILGLTAPLPAAQADEWPPLSFSAWDFQIAISSGADGPYKRIPVWPTTYAKTAAQDVNVKLDASAFAGIAEFAWPANCTAQGLVAQCHWDELGAGKQLLDFGLRVRALPNVGAGAKATVAISGTSANLGSFISASSTLTLASGVDISVVTPEEFRGVAPGSTLDVPVTILNSGNLAAKGLTLQVTGDTPDLMMLDRFSNCTYNPTGSPAGDDLAHCVFDEVVAPGEYELSAPLRFKVGADTVRANFSIDGRADAWSPGPGTPGTGPKLTLKAKGPTVPVKPTQGAPELDYMGNTEIGWVYTSLTSDYAAVPTSITGVVGQTGTAEFAAKNVGTGAATNGVNLRIEIPRGAVVGTLPSGCYAGSPDPVTTKVTVSCSPSPRRVPAGGTLSVVLPLRLDAIVKGSTATLTVEPDVVTDQIDANPADNTAPITLSIYANAGEARAAQAAAPRGRWHVPAGAVPRRGTPQ
ncbi:hypothetical protein [Uniformispora flossi]